MRVEIGAPAPAVTLLGASDAAVPLAQLHRERPLVLYFLRHFG